MEEMELDFSEKYGSRTRGNGQKVQQHKVLWDVWEKISLEGWQLWCRAHRGCAIFILGDLQSSADEEPKQPHLLEARPALSRRLDHRLQRSLPTSIIL